MTYTQADEHISVYLSGVTQQLALVRECSTSLISRNLPLFFKGCVVALVSATL